MSKNILTSQKKDFSQWYTDVVKIADLADYGPVKGTMIIKPYGYAIWELIQGIFDNMIKAKGINNAYYPLFIPESFLKKEKSHVKGFSPELAVVTYAGGSKLEEPIVVRPTSETIIYDAYSRWISSYRDLPYETNQWCNIVRWEKRTKPFLRTSEFLWQEGHSAMATKELSAKKAIERLEEYRKFLNNVLAIPVFTGVKSESEKFAGAVFSGSCEALLKDGKALQSATSHDLGENFSKPFEIMYEDKDSKRKYASISSWGMSTRTIGAIIMTHGDDRGLVLPPLVSPIQVVILPIYKNDAEKAKVLAMAEKVQKICGDFRVHLDLRQEVGLGWKINEWEIKGVPLRIEIGPKDVEDKGVTVAKRTSDSKIQLKIDQLDIEKILFEIQEEIYDKAYKLREENTHKVTNYADFVKNIKEKKGFYLASWCGDASCEAKIKEETKATTRVIIREDKPRKGEKCFHCGKAAKHLVYFAKAY